MLKKLLPVIIITFLVLSACTQQKQLIYLNNVNSDSTNVFIPNNNVPDYKIQQRDILYIKILTLNEEMNNLLNVGSNTNSQMYQNETNLFINGYTVDDSGKIELPIIGKIEVLHSTIEEAQRNIKKQAGIYLKNPTVFVKLISFKYTVLGEVNKPGSFKNNNNQLTILEAIGKAGDLTNFGNRRKILILRPTQEGTEVFRVDLTDKNLLSSKAYFLLPNDIVYIEPVKSKIFRINMPSLSILLSSITTLIIVLNYINIQSKP